MLNRAAVPNSEGVARRDFCLCTLLGMSLVQKLDALRAAYRDMARLENMTPQARGQRFNDWIADLLRAYGVVARENQRSLGEVDVHFSLENLRFILEAKWTKAKADTGQLAKLQKRVRQRLSGTYGVFVSMAGYTPEALADLTQGERLELILLDREHVDAMLAGEISPIALFMRLIDEASFTGRAYTPMAVVRQSIPGTPRADRVYREGQSSERFRIPLADVRASTDDRNSQSWDPYQGRRGNPIEQCHVFYGYQTPYWVLVALLTLAAVITLFVAIFGSTSWKLACSAALMFEVVLIVGFWRLAMQPIRLEIGQSGIQVFFPSRVAWMPWEKMERVDVVRVDGNPCVVAWSSHASLFPTKGESGMGAHFIPALRAIALCPLGPIHAKRHEVLGALHGYGQGRI
jgi:Holliday junction resolvase-like predicted endonuclease